MTYSIVIVYNTADGQKTANTLCQCDSDAEAAASACKWAINRWPIWKELVDITAIISISVRQYPILKPNEDGYIGTGNTLPFFEFRPNKTTCGKGISEAIKPWLKALRELARQ